MSEMNLKKKSKTTAFVLLDTSKCKACWECLSVCPQNVIGRINLPWHKHARFINYTDCIGCMKCAKICKAQAIIKLP